MHRVQSINPATLELLAEYPGHSDEHLHSVMHRARHAQREWRQRSMEERAISLQKLAHLLREKAEIAASLMALEMGKPHAQGRAETLKCALCCEYYAHEAAEMLADIDMASEYRSSRVVFQPLGTVLAIMPWNFPLWQCVRAAAPALMAGNAVIVKPSPEVSGCALLLQSMFDEAGLGDGLYSTVFATHEQCAMMIQHRDIAALTFTGSSRGGRAVAAVAGAALKKTVLELGGSDAYCVLDDADVAKAAKLCATSRLINSGQSCVAAKRFIVMESVRREFEEQFVAEIAAAVVGDPEAATTTVGPLARLDLRDLLHDQAQRSIDAGATVLLSGGAMEEGAYFKPMVLSNVKPGMAAFEEELFGPVAAIISARDEQDLIALANRSVYGLGGAVFGSESARTERVALELEAGCCFVNDFVKSDPRFPFGGVKDSGWGRELSLFGVREFTNCKSLVMA